MRCTPLLGLLLYASPAPAQWDPATLHGTLRTWAEETWLLSLDRGAARGGRFHGNGTLLRFHPVIEHEHELDVRSARFDLTDDYAWHLRDNGARYWGGSINHQDLVSGATIKLAVPLGRGWSLGARYDNEDGPPIARNLFRLTFRKAWPGGLYALAEGSLSALKPDDDITLGVGWRDDDGEATLTVTLLDAFNDIVYQVLEVYPGFADTALDYERQPLALRSFLERRLGRRFRWEAHSVLQRSSQVRTYRQLAPDDGFRQHDEFRMSGTLLEWSAHERLRLGVFGTEVRAETGRVPLPDGRAADDYRLIEETARVGLYALAQLEPRWRLEAWTARETRSEQRTYRSGAAQNTDYADRSVIGSVSVRYLAPAGFYSATAFEWDLRDVLRGDGEVPAIGSLGRRNTRLRLEFGWRFGTTAWLSAGGRMDTDGDAPPGRHKWFDGAQGRFVAHW